MSLIREMRQQDLEAVLAIEQAGQRSPWSRGLFEASLQGQDHCLVLEDKDIVVAFIIFTMQASEGELLHIAVDPQDQRQGHARALLSHMLAVMKEAGVEQVFLEVRASNQPAIALYQGAGFRQTGVRPWYYPAAKGHPAEDAILYTLTFS